MSEIDKGEFANWEPPEEYLEIKRIELESGEIGEKEHERLAHSFIEILKEKIDDETLDVPKGLRVHLPAKTVEQVLYREQQEQDEKAGNGSVNLEPELDELPMFDQSTVLIELGWESPDLTLDEITPWILEVDAIAELSGGARAEDEPLVLIENKERSKDNLALRFAEVMGVEITAEGENIEDLRNRIDRSAKTHREYGPKGGPGRTMQITYVWKEEDGK